MESGHRFLLLTFEIVALGLVLAMVPEPGARTVMGVLLAVLIARTVWTPASAGVQGPPEGLPERRGDHLFRHWLNVLIKKIREFHAVCQAVREERVNPGVGQVRIREIERELQELISEVTDLAKPQRLRGRRWGRSRKPPADPAAKPYSEPRSLD